MTAIWRLILAANLLTVMTMAIGVILWVAAVLDLESLTSLVIKAAIGDGAFHALVLVFLICFYIYKKLFY